MPTIHVILGPIGSGKSAFAFDLAARYAAPRLILNDWMTTLFSPDRPLDAAPRWYLDRASRCREQIWKLAAELLSVGSDVILELGLLRRSERQPFFARLDAAGHPATIYLLEASRDLRRQRVMFRNFRNGGDPSLEVSPELFEVAADLWEPLNEEERRGRDIQIISTQTSNLTQRMIRKFDFPGPN